MKKIKNINYLAIIFIVLAMFSFGENVKANEVKFTCNYLYEDSTDSEENVMIYWDIYDDYSQKAYIIKGAEDIKGSLETYVKDGNKESIINWIIDFITTDSSLYLFPAWKEYVTYADTCPNYLFLNNPIGFQKYEIFAFDEPSQVYDKPYNSEDALTLQDLIDEKDSIVLEYVGENNDSENNLLYKKYDNGEVDDSGNVVDVTTPDGTVLVDYTNSIDTEEEAKATLEKNQLEIEEWLNNEITDFCPDYKPSEEITNKESCLSIINNKKDELALYKNKGEAYVAQGLIDKDGVFYINYFSEIKSLEKSLNSMVKNLELGTLDINYGELNCLIFGEKTTPIIAWVVQIIRVGVPILVIFLTMIDFLKIVFIGDEKKNKEAVDKLIKRLIIAVIIFVLPILITLILDLSGLLGQFGLDGNLFCSLF